MKICLLNVLLLLIASPFLLSQHQLPESGAAHKTQRKIIEELAGATALENGAVITNRSSFANRALTREYLQGLIRDLGLEPVEQKYSMPNVNPIVDLLFNPFRGANVYTTLPATNNSDEYLVVGAHFDTELGCPGAIDNATGVSLIYEVFLELSKLQQRSKNVILVFFDQEEEDLTGSQAFVKHLKAKGLNVHSVHTFDSIGWDEDGDRAVELSLPTPYLEAAYKEQARHLGIPIHLSPSISTDHHSFREAGFNTVGMTDEYYNGDYSPWKDTPSDKFATVNLEYLSSSTVLVTNTIKELVK